MEHYNSAPASGQLVTAAVELEADSLGAIFASPVFNRILPYLEDYEDYLGKLKNDSARKKQISKLLGSDRTIVTTSPTAELAEIFCIAHIIACCDLFLDWRIPWSQLNRDGMRLLTKRATASIEPAIVVTAKGVNATYTEQEKRVLGAVNQVQNLDTIRVLQVVRLLGLMNTNSAKIRQLSMAVGNAYSDMFGVHAFPALKRQTENTVPMLCLGIDQQKSSHTVLIDNNPVYADHFTSLNEEHTGRVLAMNTDLFVSMDELTVNQAELNLEPRNLILGLRIDHRMFENIREFLSKTSALIEDNADLLMTIGAGNNVAEFEGRLACFDEFFALLSDAGMKPVRIKMHADGSSEQQRSKPHFGHVAYTSYEILHCKLQRDKLKKFNS